MLLPLYTARFLNFINNLIRTLQLRSLKNYEFTFKNSGYNGVAGYHLQSYHPNVTFQHGQLCLHITFK